MWKKISPDSDHAGREQAREFKLFTIEERNI